MVNKPINKDQALGTVILALCAIIVIVFVMFLFLYDPYISSWLNIGAATEIRFWIIATPVAVTFIAIMIIGAWIGYTMATTPPPKPIEKITEETNTPINSPTTTT